MSQRAISDYNSVFDHQLIPSDLKNNQYINAHNSKFMDSTKNCITEKILVDSSARNWDKEDSNDYMVTLKTEMHYVHSIELVDGYIPVSGYVIDEHNNSMYFQETKNQINYGSYCTATIPSGCYDITTLLNHLSVSMNTASIVKNKYKCIVDSLTQRVTITCKPKVDIDQFNLIFTDGDEVIGDRGFMETLVIDPYTNLKELRKVETSNNRRRYIAGSIGRIIGFKAINLTGCLEYVGQQAYTLRPYEYLALFVNTENSEDFRNIISCEPTNGADSAFAIVQLDRESDSFELSNKRRQIIENLHYIKTFNPPISFSKIRIRFKTPYGHLYNFNGLDNYLLFEVKRAYNRESIGK